MSTSDRILFTNIDLLKTFIDTRAPKKWFYGYIILCIYIALCVKNKSIKCQDLTTLFNFRKLHYNNLLN